MGIRVGGPDLPADDAGQPCLAIIVNDVKLVEIPDHARCGSHVLVFGFGCSPFSGLQVGCQERKEQLSAQLLGARVIERVLH